MNDALSCLADRSVSACPWGRLSPAAALWLGCCSTTEA